MIDIFFYLFNKFFDNESRMLKRANQEQKKAKYVSGGGKKFLRPFGREVLFLISKFCS